MRRFITYWLPPILWASVILTASTDLFSGANTGGVLERILVWITGYHFLPSTLDTLNFIIRKCAHLTGNRELLENFKEGDKAGESLHGG